MAQNIYDTPDFFDAYSRLARSVHGLAGAPEWRAVKAMLPPLAGRRVVDLGCGFGWFSRWAAEQGASRILSFDISENMLARARQATCSPAIDYVRADLETVTLPEEAFYLAYSSLAFHYVEDFGRLIGTIARSLAPNGRLVFTTEHPIYMASNRPGWVTRDDGEKTWPVDHYAMEGVRTTDWLANGVIKYHRTLGTTLNTLIAAGFSIQAVHEWHPTAEQLAEHPGLSEEAERPMLVLVSARLDGGNDVP